jgi:hypothetical protein
MSYIQAVSGNVMEYNAMIFDYDWDPKEKLVIDFLTTAARVNETFKAIHIDQSTKSPVFEFSSDEVD